MTYLGLAPRKGTASEPRLPRRADGIFGASKRSEGPCCPRAVVAVKALSRLAGSGLTGSAISFGNLSCRYRIRSCRSCPDSSRCMRAVGSGTACMHRTVRHAPWRDQDPHAERNRHDDCQKPHDASRCKSRSRRRGASGMRTVMELRQTLRAVASSSCSPSCRGLHEGPLPV